MWNRTDGIFSVLITTIDYDGYYQPSPPTPDWPHISELLGQGWTLVRLFEMERQEAMALFVHANPVTNHYGEKQREKSVVYTDDKR